MSTSTTPGRDESTQKSTPTPQEIAKKYPRLEALLYDREDWHRGPAIDLVETWRGQYDAAVQVLENLCMDIGNSQLWAVFHSMKAHELMMDDIVRFLYASSVGHEDAGQEDTPDEAWSPQLLAAHGAVDHWSLENAGLIEAMHAVLPDSPDNGDLPMWSLIAAMRRHNEALLTTVFRKPVVHAKLAAVPNTESPAPGQ